jgi:hypothetical protein
MTAEKLTSFHKQHVNFVETQIVKEGVFCDIYSFDQDNSKDLGIVTVTKGFKTPLQRILQGDRTIECFMSGVGTLNITKDDGRVEKYEFTNQSEVGEIVVEIGEIMQWEAGKNNDLIFYEICYPPYQDGRFKNISD